MKINKNNSAKYEITVVGTGATGSQLLPFLTQLLANLKEHSIKLVDEDIFETKNMKNQKCILQDIGRPKAEVLCERYQAVYPEIDIRYVNSYVKSKEQLMDHLVTSRNSIPILVGCVDNNATRKIFHDVFYDERISNLIYIDSGNGTTQRIGQVVVGYKQGKSVDDESYKHGRKTKQIGEVKLPPAGDMFPEILADNDDIEKVLSCSVVSEEAPQNISTNIMATVTVFSLLNNILTFDKITSHISYFSAEKPEIISRMPQAE
jgi:hypothetical protein